jgi:hypothetical protein
MHAAGTGAAASKLPGRVEATRTRAALLVRKVLLPPVLAGAAVSCLLCGLALTVAGGSRPGAAIPLARTPAPGEQLAIGLSLELAGTAALLAGPRAFVAPRATSRKARRSERRDREPASRAPRRALLATPVAGVVRGCGTFGCPRPGHLHNGVDFLAPAGTPVRAAAAGRVALLQLPGQSGGYGNFVCLQHRPDLATCYAHLSVVAARVRTGARVRRGQIIGLVGATGSASTPHLHFEVRRGPAACQACAVDPLALLANGAATAGGAAAGDGATLAPATAHQAATPAPRRPAQPGPGAREGGPAGPPAPMRRPAPEPDESLVQVAPARPEHLRLDPEPMAQPPAPAASEPPAVSVVPDVAPAAPAPAAAVPPS